MLVGWVGCVLGSLQISGVGLGLFGWFVLWTLVWLVWLMWVMFLVGGLVSFRAD